MSTISDLVETEIANLSKTISYIKKELARAPEGSLIWSESRGKPHYYHKINGERKYIPNKDRELAVQLAQKDYYEEDCKMMGFT